MRTISCWLFLIPVSCLLAINHSEIHRRNFDSSTTPTEQIFVKAYHNQSLPCPGANEHSLVNGLQWILLTQDKKILEYSKSSLTVYTEQHRISLAKDYGLTIHPTLAPDTGDYICLINGRPEPDGVIQLRVLDVSDPPGRPLIVSFTSRTADLSWASPQNTHYSAIKYYIIHSRNRDNIDAQSHTPTEQLESILAVIIQDLICLNYFVIPVIAYQFNDRARMRRVLGRATKFFESIHPFQLKILDIQETSYGRKYYYLKIVQNKLST